MKDLGRMRLFINYIEKGNLDLFYIYFITIILLFPYLFLFLHPSTIYHIQFISSLHKLLYVLTISFVIFYIPPFVSYLLPLYIYLLSLSNTKFTFNTPVNSFSGRQSINADGNFFLTLSHNCLAIKLHPQPPQYAISITILLFDPLKLAVS